MQGEAEAYAIEVKAKAEAEQMAKKADAWKEYKEAALVDMMLQVRASRIDSHLDHKQTKVYKSKRCNL